MDFDQTWSYLVLKRIWNPIDFQGQRSRSLGQIFRLGDMPRFVLVKNRIVLQKTMTLFCDFRIENIHIITSVVDV